MILNVQNRNGNTNIKFDKNIFYFLQCIVHFKLRFVCNLSFSHTISCAIYTIQFVKIHPQLLVRSGSMNLVQLSWCQSYYPYKNLFPRKKQTSPVLPLS